MSTWPLQKGKSSLPRGTEFGEKGVFGAPNPRIFNQGRRVLMAIWSLACVTRGGGRTMGSGATHRVIALSSTGKSAHGMLVSISDTFGCNLFVPTEGRVSRGYS